MYSSSVRKIHSILFAFILQFAILLVFADEDDGDDEDDDGDDEDDDDDVKFGTGAIIGVVLGVLAILIAIPILLCFCCGCCCFREKKEKIIGVTSSASATLRKQHSQKATDPEMVIVEDDKNRKFSQCSPSAPSRRDSELVPPGYTDEFVPHPLDNRDNMGIFYYNLGFEPPPEYEFPSDSARPSIQHNLDFIKEKD